MQTHVKTHQLGGILKLFIIPSPLIHHIEGSEVFCISQDPTLELECKKESIQHQVSHQKTASGNLYSHSTTAFLPGNADEHAEFLSALTRYRYMIVLQTSSGSYMRCGCNQIGLIFSYNWDSTSDPSISPGYKIQFTGNLNYDLKPVSLPVGIV